MLNNILNEKTIGTAKVTVDIVPKGHCIPNTKITPACICVHQTGNVDTSARANHNYLKNINKSGERKASWHITVDDKEIIQAAPTNMKCLHAGTSKGNNTSIGIEIAMFSDKEKQRKAYLNAIELIKVLIGYHNFTADKVKRHKDFSGKHCPAWLIENKFGYSWSWFINQINESISFSNKDKDDGSFLVKVLVDELNVRTGPSTDYRVVGQVRKDDVYTIVKTNGNFGFLKSGKGWISIHSKYVKKL